MSSSRSLPVLVVPLIAAVLGALSAPIAQATDNSLALNRLIFVSAAGTPTENGQGLLDTLDRIADAGEDKRYTLRLEPGTYDVGQTTVTMKSFVDIEGSGQETTLITGDPDPVVVLGAANSEVRHVTIEHQGGVLAAVAMLNAESVRVSNVTLRASGGTESVIGCFNNSGSEPVLTNVLIEVDGTGVNSQIFGIANLTSSPLLDNVRIRADNGGSEADAFGIDNATPALGAQLVISDVDIEVSAPGAVAWGITISGASDPPAQVLNSRVVVKASSTATGIEIGDSDVQIRNSSIDVGFVSPAAQGPSGTPSGSNFHGIVNIGSSGTHQVQIDNSQINSLDATIVNDTEFTTRVGGSLLAGGNVNDSAGTVICAGVWDDDTVFYASLCPGQP